MPAAIKHLQDENKALNEKIEHSNKKRISSEIDGMIDLKKEVNGTSYIVYEIKNSNGAGLVEASDILRKQIQDYFIFLTSETNGKNIFVCSATKALIEKGISAAKFVSSCKDELSLRGGGKDALVQGVIANKGEDFLIKVENCIVNFLAK
jgi:alanyl-tRNA synthetase